MKKLFIGFITLIFLLSGCHSDRQSAEDTQIHLSDNSITVDGREISNDPSQAVYAGRDIVFYLSGQGFTYGEGTKQDEHAQSEADAHTVVHIGKPGRYVLSGKLSLGQIAIDLGKDAQDDPEAVVTLVLNGVDITCTVAPAVIFYNVYECGSRDEKSASKEVDTTKAGANVIVADGTENNITGSYVAKIYKSYELNEDGTKITDSKKLHKYDGAFYAKQTMNINGGDKGTGVLNIHAENEGLDTELHLTINGGIINITSGNDGINTNEDNVSVTTINGGTLNILCDGRSGEGDGIDSNGWLVINGGAVTAQACSSSNDAGIDSDKGIYINGGKVMATGNMLDHIAGGNQTYAVFSFTDRQKGGNTYTLKNSAGEAIGVYAPANDFSFLIIAGDELAADSYTFWQGQTQLSGRPATAMQGGIPQGGRPGMPNNGQGTPPEPPEGMARPDMPNNGQGTLPEPPEGMARPDMPEGMMPPANGGAMPGENKLPGGEASTTFPFANGGNYFTAVGPVAL